MISSFEGKTPIVKRDTYVHPSADVIGAVEIGSGCWVGPGARIRGDYGSIVIGDNTCVQDNCVIHAMPGEHMSIGNWVTIAHAAVVHNATIKDWAIVGIGSIVPDFAIVGEWAVLGAGAVLEYRQEIPDGAMASGIPACLLAENISEASKGRWTALKKTYVDLVWRYKTELSVPAPA